MSVGKHRTPTRLLDIANISMAYPGEILIDPNTGNFVYLTNNLTQVLHKKPGKLTVKSGEDTLINAQDMSDDITINLPNYTQVEVGTLTVNNGSTPVVDHADLSGDVVVNLPEIKSPGTLTVMHGSNTVISNADLSGAVIVTLPEIKSPGTLTIKHGTTTLLNAGDLSSALTVTIPADQNVYPTSFAWANGTTSGPTGTLTLSNSTSVSFGAIPVATASVSGVVSTTTQTFAGAKTFSTSIKTPTLTVSTAGNATGIAKNYDTSIATGWSGSSAPYTRAVTVSGIRSTDRPIIDFRATGTYSTDKKGEEAFLNIYRAVTGSNTITFYAHEKPTVAINIQVKVIR